MILAEVKDTDNRKEIRARRELYLSQFFIHNKGCFLLTLWLRVMISIYCLMLSWILQRIMDAAAQKNMQEVGNVLVVFGVTFTLFCIICWGQRTSYPMCLKRGTEQYKEYVFSKIMDKQYGAFFREGTEKYISALTNDVNIIEKKYFVAMFSLADMGIRFAGAIIMMIMYSPMFTLIAVLFSLLPMLASSKVGDKLVSKEQIVSQKSEEFVGSLKDLLTGFNLIKGFKVEKEAKKIFQQKDVKLESERCNRRKTEETINFLGMLTGNIVQVGVFLVGAIFCILGEEITPGIVLAFVQLMSHVIIPIKQVPLLLANRKSAVALVDKIAESLAENVAELGYEYIPKKIEKGICVENLFYEYEKNNSLLMNVDVEFEVGKCYAIVGESGSGKSTLLNLLMGMTKVYRGNIFFDEKELRNINSESLYDCVALVQQNVFIFNDTILNNITMFQKYSMEKVTDAIEKAGLVELIKERGQNYMCGENGCNLSGGEKQRIALARALIQEKSVMLFDEVTAALDADTAFSVSKLILELKDIIRIVVTHRLDEELLSCYDQIYVMKNGQIVEQGTYDMLLQRKGILSTWMKGSRKYIA